MKRRTIGARLAAFVLVLHAVGALAQTTAGGSVRGYIKDEQGAVLPGVAVTAASADVPGVHLAVADASGFFRLLDLPPADYTVSAKLQGFQSFSRDHVVVRAGVNLGVDIIMKVGSVEESVNVVAETPLLDSTKAATTLNITGDFQRSVPLAARKNWSDVLYMAPGLVVTDGINSNNFYFNGADSGSMVIQLDGADIAAGVQSSVNYVYMSSELLSDTQLVVAGADASAPLGVGAVVNLVSRSGTNRVKASAGIILQNQSWSGNNNPTGTTSAFSLTQPDVTMGGPIVKDHAWFFGSYRYTNVSQGISRSAAQLAAMTALAPSFDPFNVKTRDNQTFIKGTAQFNSRQQLQVFGQYGRDKRSVPLTIDTADFMVYGLGGGTVSSRWSSIWRDNLTTRAAVTYSDLSNPLTPVNPNVPSRSIYQSAFSSTGVLVGNNQLAVLDNYAFPGQTAPAGKLTISFDANYAKSGRTGTHEVKVGAYLNPLRLYKFNSLYANNGFYLEEDVLKDPNNPAAGFVPFHRKIYDDSSVQSADVNSTDYAGYVQDDWHAGDRLTLNLGVRFDKIKREDNLFSAVLQDTWAIGPRFGITYALTADHKNIARATLSRVHDAASTGSGSTAGQTAGGFKDLYDLNLDGTFETTLVTPGRTTATVNRVVDLDGYKQQHVNELTLGYRRQLAGEISLDLGFVRREFRDNIAAIDTNPIYTNGVFTGLQNPAFNQFFLLTSNVWNWPVYSSVDVQVAKQSNRFQVVASYTRQFRHLAGTWAPNDPASIIQPDAFANDKGINNVLGASSSSPNSLSGTDSTLIQQWRDHAFRVALSYSLPWSIHVATSFSYQSGVWSGPIVTKSAAADPRFGPTSLLINGRVVPNPLATTIRFASPTRGDGQFEGDAQHPWNIRLSRRFVANGTTIEPAVDVLNVTNNAAFENLQSGANQLYNPNFGAGNTRVVPRSAELSIRASW
jgi:hypothetical protein